MLWISSIICCTWFYCCIFPITGFDFKSSWEVLHVGQEMLSYSEHLISPPEHLISLPCRGDHSSGAPNFILFLVRFVYFLFVSCVSSIDFQLLLWYWSCLLPFHLYKRNRYKYNEANIYRRFDEFMCFWGFYHQYTYKKQRYLNKELMKERQYLSKRPPMYEGNFYIRAISMKSYFYIRVTSI